MWLTSSRILRVPDSKFQIPDSKFQIPDFVSNTIELNIMKSGT
jgi:hypothetical protein